MRYNTATRFSALVCVLSLLLAMLQVIPMTASASTYEITGTDNIIRPPVGSYASNKYTIEGYTGDVVWSIEDWITRIPNTATEDKYDYITEATSKPEGVFISQEGELIVPGSAPDATNDVVHRGDDVLENATFKVIAKDTVGNLLAEKEVTYINELNVWSYNAGRIFDDFERVTDIANNTWDTRGFGGTSDVVKYNFKRGENDSCVATVANEGGNKYIMSKGFEAVKWSTCSWFAIEPQNLSKMNGHPYITMEAKFKNEIADTNGHNLWFVASNHNSNENTKGSLDIRFKRANADDTSVDIIIYMDSNGEGLAASGNTVATVATNTWITSRVEIDTVSGTFDLYINDERVAEDVPTAIKGTNAKIPFVITGSSIDDFAMYSGKRIFTAGADIPKAIYRTSGSNDAGILLPTALKLGTAAIPGEENSVKYYDSNNDEITGGIAFVNDTPIDIVSKSTNNKYPMEYTNTVAISAGIEAEGPYTERYTTTGLNMDGRLYLSFKYTGKPEITLLSENGYSYINASSNAAQTKDAFVVIDTYGGEYTAIFDNTKSQGSIKTGDVTALEINGCSELTDINFASADKHKPYLTSPYAEGVPAIGLTITAKYDFYSPLGLSEKSKEIEWYISSDGTDYSKVATGESFSPRQEHYNMYVRFEAKAGDKFDYESDTVVSPSYLVLPTFSAQINAGNLDVTAYNIFSDENLYCIADLYSGSVHTDTVFTEIDFSSGAPSRDLSIPLSGANGAIVSIARTNSLKAADGYKTAGNVPAVISLEDKNANDKKAEFSGGKLYITTDNDDIANVLIYGHTSIPGEFNSAYYNIYSSGEVFDTESKELIWAVGLRTAADKKTVIDLPGLSGGAYTADIVLDSGERYSYIFISKPELLLTETNVTSDGFDKVLKLHDDTLTDAQISSAITEFAQTNGKNHIFTLTDNDIDNFYSAVKLVHYLEGRDSTDANYNNVKNIMTALSMNTKGLELIKENADPAATGSAVLSSGFTDFASLSDKLYEKAVLYGVYQVKSYLEADTFIKDLGCSNYTEANKDGICTLVHNKLYNSITELKNAIQGYTPVIVPGTGGGASPGNGTKPNISVDPGMTNPVKKDRFTDVPSTHWANEAVSYLSERDIVNGKTNELFDPDSNITRAEYASIIARAFNIKNVSTSVFTDVISGEWYFDTVNALAGIDIVKGANGVFRPNDDISREEAAVILCRMLRYKELELKYSEYSFLDAGTISDYALEDIKTLYSNDIIQGYNGSFMPKDNMTRAECSQMIANALRRYSL